MKTPIETTSKNSSKFEKLWTDAHATALDSVTNAAIRFGFIADQAGAEKLNTIAAHTGPCGFAWVSVVGNSSFLKWLKSQPNSQISKDLEYGGNIIYWVGEYNQCMMWKQLYAEALAKHLRAAGLQAKARSRMD